MKIPSKRSLIALLLMLNSSGSDCLAQDLDALLQGAGIDPATLQQAQLAMGAKADPVAAKEYSDGTKAGMAGDMDAAIAHLSRATTLAPNFASAHFNLGCAYARKGMKEKALGSLRSAIRIDASYKRKAQSESDFSSLSGEREFVALVR